MKIVRFAGLLAVPALCVTASLCLGSSVNADGLASKHKSRIPMQPGLSIDRDLLRQAFILVPAVPSKTERVSMKLRKDERAAARRTVEATPAPVVITEVSRVASVSVPGRERLAQKGVNVPTDCKKLHTHERARCIAEVQFKKSVRGQLMTQK